MFTFLLHGNPVQGGNLLFAVFVLSIVVAYYMSCMHIVPPGSVRYLLN